MTASQLPLAVLLALAALTLTACAPSASGSPGTAVSEVSPTASAQHAMQRPASSALPAVTRTVQGDPSAANISLVAGEPLSHGVLEPAGLSAEESRYLYSILGWWDRARVALMAIHEAHNGTLDETISDLEAARQIRPQVSYLRLIRDEVMASSPPPRLLRVRGLLIDAVNGWAELANNSADGMELPLSEVEKIPDLALQAIPLGKSALLHTETFKAEVRRLAPND